jgi:ubiquinone/menaquinone biosynthesis C-methylase UbiE
VLCGERLSSFISGSRGEQMTTETERPIEERIVQVLKHLGIAQAHVAARVPGDWQGLAATHPERLASLTLVCPQGMEPGVLGPLASRLLVIAGDQGRPAERAQRVVMNLPEATLHILRAYVSPTPYTDLAVDRTNEIGTAMTGFLARIDQRRDTRKPSLPEGKGEIAGIVYRVQGAGPPLVLLPLSVAPSQWEPLLPELTRRYCTITLSGPALGMVGSLEARGRTAGYLSVVGRLLEAAHLEPGEVVLEVGCGTGVLDRWLARRTGGANPIVAVDINRFLLQEAMALARQEALEHLIEFREGNAEALPLPDNSVDVAMSSTVIQRVDADRMLAEMVRVTKRGGRVAVVGHAHDMSRWVNLPLRPELKAKVEAPGWADESGHPLGCDDASLYRRLHQAGLTQVRMFPQLATFDDRSRLQQLQASILPTLNPEETREWRGAVAQGEAEGTFFIATPFHCTVGTKA